MPVKLCLEKGAIARRHLRDGATSTGVGVSASARKSARA